MTVLLDTEPEVVSTQHALLCSPRRTEANRSTTAQDNATITFSIKIMQTQW